MYRTLQSHGGTARYAVWLVLALLVLTIAGCGGSTRNDPTAEATATAAAQAAIAANLRLAGTAWEVAHFFGPDPQVAVLPDTRLSTVFMADRYAGFAGCNWYLGVYYVDETALTFESPASTYVVCADEAVNQQESQFFSTMANTIAHKFEGEQLLAYTSEDQLLITYSPAEPVPFEGTPWSLKFIAADDDIAAVIPFTAVTATFAEDRITGSGGCSEYSASYTRDEQAMTISDIQVTQAQCSDPNGIMEQEAVFLQSLANVVAYEQAGGMLMLFDASGAPALLLGTP